MAKWFNLHDADPDLRRRLLDEEEGCAIVNDATAAIRSDRRSRMEGIEGGVGLVGGVWRAERHCGGCWFLVFLNMLP